MHVFGQVLKILSRFWEDPGHVYAEPLHGMAAEVRLRPAGRDHQRGKRIERGVSEMRGGAFHSPDRCGQRRRRENQADGNAQDEQGKQRHPNRDMQVEQELLQRRVILDEGRHDVAAPPHEGEARRHEPVNQAYCEVVFLMVYRHFLLDGVG